jgi:predicted SPOUT superfamily RNA methylase MTH1
VTKPTRKGNTIYCIIHSASGEFCAFGSKVARVTIGAAKNAFVCHMSKFEDGYTVTVRIEDQDEYEIIEVSN